jgi:hypothetical protein
LEADRINRCKSIVEVSIDANRKLLWVELVARPVGGPSLIIANNSVEALVVD